MEKKKILLIAFVSVIATAFFSSKPASASTLYDQSSFDVVKTVRDITWTRPSGSANEVILKLASDDSVYVSLTNHGATPCYLLTSSATDYWFNVNSNSTQTAVRISQYSDSSCTSLISSTSDRFKIYGTASTGETETICSTNGPGGCTSYSGNGTWKPYGKIGTGLTWGDLTITDPFEGEFLLTGLNYTFSGTCPTDGTNVLNLSLADYSNRPNDSSDFDIDCVDHTWSASFTILGGGNGYAIRSIDWLDDKCSSLIESCPTENIVTVFGNNTAGWNLGLMFPSCDNEHCILYPGDWTFRFNYDFPDNLDPGDINFVITDCESDFFTTCSSGYSASLDDADSENLGYVDTTIPVVEENVDHYYVVTLEQGATIKIVFYLHTYGDPNSTIKPHDPDSYSCKALGIDWCWLIVPRLKVVTSFINKFNDQISTKIPFGYFYYAKDRITNLNISNTNTAIEVPLTSGATNISIPVNFGDNALISNTGTTIKTIITVVIWIGFLAWVVNKFIP